MSPTAEMRVIAHGAFAEILHAEGADVVYKRVFHAGDSDDVLQWEFQV